MQPQLIIITLTSILFYKLRLGPTEGHISCMKVLVTHILRMVFDLKGLRYHLAPFSLAFNINPGSCGERACYFHALEFSSASTDAGVLEPGS